MAYQEWRIDRTVARYAWVVFVVISVIGIYFGASDLTELTSYDAQAAARNGLATALLTLAISVTALRRGERWAWIAMLVWPAAQVHDLWTVQRTGHEGGLLVLAFLVISAVTLALSAPTFLARRAP